MTLSPHFGKKKNSMYMFLSIQLRVVRLVGWLLGSRGRCFFVEAPAAQSRALALPSSLPPPPPPPQAKLHIATQLLSSRKRTKEYLIPGGKGCGLIFLIRIRQIKPLNISCDMTGFTQRKESIISKIWILLKQMFSVFFLSDTIANGGGKTGWVLQ